MFKLVADTGRILFCMGNKLNVKLFQKCCQTSKSFLLKSLQPLHLQDFTQLQLLKGFLFCFKGTVNVTLCLCYLKRVMPDSKRNSTNLNHINNLEDLESVCLF